MNHAGRPCICCGRLPTSESQSFYFADDHPSMPSWFKGMEQIIVKRGLWPEGGLPAHCHKFKCPPSHVDCCCQCVLFIQPDFTDQRSQLQELIEKCCHLCDFYPNYHCKRNFIKQYWGAAKARYCVTPRAKTVHNMEKSVKDSLDVIPLLLQIQWVVLFFLLSLFFFDSSLN